MAMGMPTGIGGANNIGGGGRIGFTSGLKPSSGGSNPRPSRCDVNMKSKDYKRSRSSDIPKIKPAFKPAPNSNKVVQKFMLD